MVAAAISAVYVLTTYIPEDGMSDPLFDIYQNVESKKELWDSLKAKYMVEDASSTKFLVSCIIDKLPPSWKDFKHTLKHNKEELTLVELGSHLRIEESLRAQDSDKPKGNNVVGPQLNIVNYIGLSQGFWGEAMLTTCYLLNMVPNKRNRITPYELWTKRKPNLRVWGCRAVVRLPDPKLKTLGERGIECILFGYAEHSKAFRIDSIQSVDQVSAFQIELKILVVQWSLKRSLKRTRDEVSDQHSYCFNVDDDPKTFDEATKSQDVAFWEEAINDEMDSIMGNNIWVLADLPPCCKPLDCKWIFKRKLKVDGTTKKFKVRLVIQGFRHKSGIDYFDTYAPVARISTIRLLIAMASIHNLIIHQIDVKIAFLNGELDEEVYMNQPQGFIMPGNENKVDLTKEFLSSRFSMKDIGEADVILVGKLSRLTYTSYPLVLEGYTNTSWISNTKDNSSTSGWVFLLGGAAGKEAEWLRNLILEIPLWSKPTTPIFIRCDSVATLAKAYSKKYNEKSKHLGVRHSMIHEHITNGVVSIEFVRSQRNLSDHLTKGLSRDLVLNSIEEMRLKSN
ncbi:zinc finger, CCHC-type containing protein [Tanacetum coccineum]